MEVIVPGETVFHIGEIAITNSLLMGWLAVVVLAAIAWRVGSNIKMMPGKIQSALEMGVLSLISLMEGVLGSRKNAERYFPLIATIFTLVLMCNWMGVLPGVGSIGMYEVKEGHSILVPLLRSANSDLNFTLGLAILSVVMVNFYGIRELGVINHASKFISFKSPISFFVGILELMGEFAKVVSFSFRLFGNIFAGEVLMIITGYLAPFIVPIPFIGLELFVGFVQALVFATLTLVFLSISVAHGH